MIRPIQQSVIDPIAREEIFEKYEQQPELFSILLNKAYISENQIEHLAVYINRAMYQIIAEFNQPIQSMDNGNMILHMNEFEDYVIQLFKIVEVFNPFNKISNKEVSLLMTLIRESIWIKSLPPLQRRDLLSMIFFVISNLSEGGDVI